MLRTSYLKHAQSWYSKLILTTENTFMLTSDFYKQTDGFPMGGLLSVIFLI